MIRPKSIVIIIFMFSLLYAPSNARSGEIPLSLSREPTGNDSFIPYYRPKRPKIALALSGGGARGFAQIGVLKVIERYGLPIDGIAGTSMGAIIGGLLSVGYSASEIEEISNQIRWEDIIQDTPPRKQLFLGQKEERDRHIIQLRFDGLSFHIPSAYTAGQHLTTMLTDIILKAPQPIKSNFDHLYIPLRVIATDLLTGTGVILKGGSLIDALRASMAIPLLFTPVQIDNAVLVDGGLVRNLPVTEAKNFGTDLIIAIDTSSKLRAIESLTAPWQIADQVTTIMQQSETISQLDSADIVIQPNLDNISNTDFGKIDTIIKEGEIAAEKIISQIYAYFMNNISPTPDSFLTFNRIEISGCQHLDPEKFLQKIKIPLSSPVPISHIIQAGQSLYQTGYFQKVAAFVDTSTLSLTFKVDENPPIQSITIIGNHIFSDSLLLENFETIPGEVLNFHKGRLDYRRLIETYRQSGYVLASIDSVRIIEDELQIYLWEGLIENIQLSGNNKTHPFVILRELPIKEGDTFSVTSLRKGIDNIYSTGYFEGVRFHLERKGHSQDLIIHVIERANTLIQAGYRYDLERYSKGFLQIVEENLLGLGSKGSFMGLLGDREKLIRARLWSDRFRNTYLTYQFSFSTGKHWYPFYENGAHTGTYNKSITEGSIKIGHHMRRFGTLSAEFRSEKIKLNPISGDNTPSDQFHLLSLIVKSEIDTRDRLPLPRTGKYHTLEYEYSGGILGGDVSYFKIFSTMESYYRLNSSFIFHPRISWGTADLRTPFPKHYRLGGLNSFIGLPEEAFTGRRYIIINGEIRYKIPWPRWLESYIAIRYDLGGIWNRYVKISSKDFKQGIGTIFSVMSPFGPIHLGYGHMSDGTSQFYLSAGFQF